MEACLSNALSCLPRVNSCCFCIKNIKCGAIVCSIWLLLFLLEAIYEPFTSALYHHKAQALPLLQSVFLYAVAAMAVVGLLAYGGLLLMLCTSIRPALGLLYVLAGLIMIALKTVWIILVFIRSFIDPGLYDCDASNHILMANITELNCEEISRASEKGMLLYLPLLLLNIYFYIVIYSWIKTEMETQYSFPGIPPYGY